MCKRCKYSRNYVSLDQRYHLMIETETGGMVRKAQGKLHVFKRNLYKGKNRSHLIGRHAVVHSTNCWKRYDIKLACNNFCITQKQITFEMIKSKYYTYNIWGTIRYNIYLKNIKSEEYTYVKEKIFFNLKKNNMVSYFECFILCNAYFRYINYP